MSFANLTVWQRYFVAALIVIPMTHGIVTNIVDFTISETLPSDQVVRQYTHYGPGF